MKPVALGIIGTGLAARHLHWPALQELRDRFRVVKVCNHTEEKAREFAALAGGVPYVLDYRELLRDPAVEAVDIVLPIHRNCQAVKDSLTAGKHVIVEKSLAATLAEAGELVELASRHPKQITLVAENYRYAPVYQGVKKLLDQGAIGRPYAALVHSLTRMDASNKYVRTPWRIKHQYPGGFILDGGIHFAAVLNYWFGDATPRAAFARSVNPDIGKVDTLSMQFTAAGGVQGVMTWFSSAQGMGERKFLVMGETGTIILEWPRATIKRTGQPDEVIEYPDDSGYRGEFEDFYGAIREGRKVLYPFKQGYKDMEVIIKALEIAETADK